LLFNPHKFPPFPPEFSCSLGCATPLCCLCYAPLVESCAAFVSKDIKKREYIYIYIYIKETKETCDQHAKRGLSSTLVGASCFHFFHIVPFFCIFFFLFSNLDLCYFSFGLLFGFASLHFSALLVHFIPTKLH